MSAGAPTTRTVSLTLPQSMQMVLNGEIQPFELYQQLPLALKSFFDESASKLQGETFQRLTIDAQRELIRAILEVTNSATDSPAVPAQTPRAQVAHSVISTERKTNKTAPVQLDRGRRQRSLSKLAIAVLLLAALAATVYWYPSMGNTLTQEASEAMHAPSSTQQSQAPPQEELNNRDLEAVAAEASPTHPTEKSMQRTWTDINDRRVEATLVGYRRGQVELMTGDGEVKAIAISKLCQDDRVFLWELAREKLGPFPLFETRIWTAAKNSTEVNAAVIGLQEDNVLLMRSDGRCFNAKRESFSPADQSYLSAVADIL